MPIFHKAAQYSEEYDRLRLGIPTSSHFHKIITPQGKPSKQWREYACLLIAERILQRKIEFYRSPAMERSLIVEADAVDWYEFDHVLQKFRSDFCVLDEIKNGLDRGLVDCPSGSHSGRIIKLNLPLQYPLGDQDAGVFTPLF